MINLFNSFYWSQCLLWLVSPGLTVTMNDCGLSASCVYIVSAERQSVSLGHLRFCSALCYVSKGICSREDNCYTVKLIYYLFIILCGDIWASVIFCYSLQLCFHQFVRLVLLVPEECVYVNCDESFLILLPLTVKLLLTWLKWVNLRYQHIPQQNPETMTQAYSFFIRMEEHQSQHITIILTWFSTHIYISPCWTFAAWDFWNS